MPSSTNLITKRSGEKLYVEMQFDACLETDTAISTIESITVQNCGASNSDLTISSEIISGQSVFFYVEGGDSGERYKILVTITTDNDETLIGDGTLVVKDS